MHGERHGGSQDAVGCPHHILLCGSLFHKHKLRLQRRQGRQKHEVIRIAHLGKVPWAPNLIVFNRPTGILRLRDDPADLILPLALCTLQASRRTRRKRHSWNLCTHRLRSLAQLLFGLVHAMQGFSSSLTLLLRKSLQLVWMQQEYQLLPRRCHDLFRRGPRDVQHILGRLRCQNALHLGGRVHLGLGTRRMRRGNRRLL
mmetsp:Transcript_96476/g.245207  ORF Transcript_96476/g.245207 Transcript_96476/m.245207 type:complete len:200 (-) Transcript_96476:576-1175(-)